jgi:CRISPR-associated protein Cmr6
MNRQQRGSTSQEARRVRPVYDNGMASIISNSLLESANIGLVYDRYADIWSGPEKNWSPEDGVRLRFMREITQRMDRAASHLGPLLEAFHARRQKLWDFNGAQAIELELLTPLASGIGMSHSLDVGFVWDRNLGVPFLPASSLKGVAFGWARDWSDDDDVKGMVKRVFGDPDDAGAGNTVFHSLYPVTPPKLRVDIINPHFGEYYRNRELPPGDWMAPVPVFFLTVNPGARFRTAIHPRTKAGEADIGITKTCLQEAVENLGVGAKTAVGYGLFQVVS